MMKPFAAFLAAILPFCALAESGGPSLGPAGLLSSQNKEDLPPVTLSAGAPLAQAPWRLKSGTYYTVEFVSDGSQDLGLVGPDFFRAIWIDRVSVEGLEIRPVGLESLAFEDEGEMELGFIALKPGRYDLRVPGTRGDLQRLEIVIE